MKINEAWLREWVSPAADTQAIAHQLTMAGLEIEGIEPVTGKDSGAVRGVVIARVEAVAPHPDADRLRVCTVFDGTDRHQVVCGAPNVRPGLLVPYATVGATLPDGTRISRARLRGVDSAGMLMSADELGIADAADGLLELDAGEPGADVAAALALDDAVIEVNLTANRGDCLSVRGIARELGVLYDMPVTPPPAPAVPAMTDAAVPVRIEAGDGCPRYLGRVIEGIDITRPTPLWMRERLRRAGLRTIDCVVDVTNYLLLELGQPMHAFDRDRLRGGITVRRARPGDRFELLDGRTVEPRAEVLLIADDGGPVAMAGVMGGAGSAVRSTGDAVTRNVFLEVAYFTPAAVAGRSFELGLQTDAAQRYERGVDPQLQDLAIERATALLVAIAGGRPGPVVRTESAAHLPDRAAIGLRGARITRLLGMAVPDDEVTRILARLDIEVLGKSGSGADAVWNVRAPSHRFDLTIEEDLIEEVCRIHGYDRVPLTAPGAHLRLARVVEAATPLERVRAGLVERGYHEVVTYSFVDAATEDLLNPAAQPLPLDNPMSSEQAVMRTSLWAGLLRVLAYNRNRQQERIRLFEIGQCFVRTAGGLDQRARIGGAIVGPRDAKHWSGDAGAVDFFDLKGDVEALLAAGGLGDAGFVADVHPALHPGQCARIRRGTVELGWIGRVHPEVARQLDLPAGVLVFELDRDLALAARVPRGAALSRQPEVRRDIAVVIDRAVAAAAILGCVRESVGELLTDLRLFDVYQGEGIDSAKKSVALGLTLQNPSRTLADAEVNDAVEAAVRALRTAFGATLRG